MLFDPEEVPAELRDCFEEVEVQCGAPWRRVVEKVEPFMSGHAHGRAATPIPDRPDLGTYALRSTRVGTNAWQPTCTHTSAEPIPCVVLDPFSGAGTTAIVAVQEGRRAIGLELNPEYVAMSERRMAREAAGYNLRMDLVEEEEQAV